MMVSRRLEICTISSSFLLAWSCSSREYGLLLTPSVMTVKRSSMVLRIGLGNACRGVRGEAAHPEGRDVGGRALAEQQISDDLAAIRPQGEAGGAVSGRQVDPLSTRHGAQDRHRIRRVGAQPHANVADVGAGEARCDAQGFAQDFTDTRRG